jgi:hypothetical protein
LAKIDAKEALEPVTQLRQTSSDVYEAETAYQAMRTLSGKPVPVELESATLRSIRQNPSPEDQRLIKSEPEYSALLAIKDMLGTRKASREESRGEAKQAAKFFLSLPGPITSCYIARFHLEQSIRELTDTSA